jgi:hypothetical protein
MRIRKFIENKLLSSRSFHVSPMLFSQACLVSIPQLRITAMLDVERYSRACSSRLCRSRDVP